LRYTLGSKWHFIARDKKSFRGDNKKFSHYVWEILGSDIGHFDLLAPIQAGRRRCRLAPIIPLNPTHLFVQFPCCVTQQIQIGLITKAMGAAQVRLRGLGVLKIE
jgi:hypothetical protein